MVSRWLVLLAVGFINAQDVACSQPVELVESIATDLRQALQPICKDGHREGIEEAIKKVIMPNVDVQFIVKQVLGRKYWYDATKEQQEELEALMNRLIVSQYAVAFNCRQLDADVTFYPLREDVSKYVRVTSALEFNKDETLVVKYALRCSDDQWKMYDFIVNGLSLGQTYRSQFSQILKSGGPQGLINFLSEELSDS